MSRRRGTRHNFRHPSFLDQTHELENLDGLYCPSRCANAVAVSFVDALESVVIAIS